MHLVLDGGWQATVTAIGTGITAAGVLASFAAILYTRAQVTETRKENVRKVASDLSERWDSDDLIYARHAATSFGGSLSRQMQDLRRLNDIEYYKMMREPNYLEDLGVMCINKAIEIRIIYDSLGDTILGRWDEWQPFIQWARRLTNDDTYFENFELLAWAVAIAPPPER